MNEDVDAAATDARLLPFGSFGPVRFKNWGQLLSGSDTPPDTYVTGAPVSHISIYCTEWITHSGLFKMEPQHKVA
jgi:hypothetical protein